MVTGDCDDFYQRQSPQTGKTKYRAIIALLIAACGTAVIISWNGSNIQSSPEKTAVHDVSGVTSLQEIQKTVLSIDNSPALSLKGSKPKGDKGDDDFDTAGAVGGGVQAALDIVKFTKEPNVKSAGAVLSSIGPLVMMAPPPAGPVIGGIMMLSGGLMTMFAPHEPSAELKAIKEVNKRLDTVIKNQQIMKNQLTSIKFILVEEFDFRKSEIEEIQLSALELTRRTAQFQSATPDELEQLRLNVFDYARSVDDRLSFMVGKLTPSTVENYVKYIDSNEGITEAAILYQELLVTRFELYQIQLYSVLARKGNTSYRQLQLLQALERDVRGYTQFADQYFRLDQCPENKKIMTNWLEEDLTECKNYGMGHTRSNQKCCYTLEGNWYYSQTWSGFGDYTQYLNGWCGHSGSYTQWADVNGDGKADIICDDSAGRHWQRLSNGDGSFRDLGQVKTGWCGHSGSYTQWADVNGDGKADMICDDSAGQHWIQLSNGDGSFRDLGQVKTGWCGHSGSNTQWADVNGDGKADMLCDDTAGRHWIQLSNGDGSFSDWGQIVSGWCGHSGSKTQWADVNGDGKADMLCDDTAGSHWIKLSNGDKTFKDIESTKTGWCGHSGSRTKYADVNGDGMADMICDDSAGTHWVLLQNGLGFYKDLGGVKTGWCGHAGSYTQWADITGDGTADMMCDDSAGSHWYYNTKN